CSRDPWRLLDPRFWLPVTCAVIGYLTNWLAIRMLFRPYEPKGIWIFKWQGLVSKDKVKVAQAIGRQTEQTLLTPSYVVRYIEREDVQEKIRLLVHRSSERLFNEKLPSIYSLMQEHGADPEDTEKDIKGFFRAAAVRFMDHPGFEDLSRSVMRVLIEKLSSIEIGSIVTEQRARALRSFASDRLEEIFKSDAFADRVHALLNDRIEHYAGSGKTMAELVPAQFRNAIKKELSREVPILVHRLKDYLTRPAIKKKVKDYLNFAYGSFVQELGFFQKLVGRLLLDDEKVRNIINSFVEESTERLVEILSSEENIKRIEDEIDTYLREKVIEKPLKEVLGRVPPSRRTQAMNTMGNRLIRALQRRENVDRFLDVVGRETSKLSDASIGKTMAAIVGRPEEEVRADIVQRVVAVLKTDEVKTYLLSRLEQGTSHALRLQVGPLNKWIAEDETELIKTRFADLVLRLMRRHTGEILQRIEIKEIVTERVKEFPIERLEQSVRDVSGNKLLWIQILGGVLGFFAGIIQVLIFFT
ncbi:DUF445 family protein, partial [Acidobacteriota bacterium]